MNGTSKLSLEEAVTDLEKFLTDHLPEGTAINVTMESLQDMVGTAGNLVAMATEQGVETGKPRQAYEAVGWLSVQLEAWAFASPYDDNVLQCWASSLGVQ